MEQTLAETLLKTQDALTETAAALFAIRQVLYRAGLTEPKEICQMQRDIRKLLDEAVPAGGDPKALLKLLKERR